MDPTITEEILNDLIPSLEALETKSAAVLEFLKKEGIASDEKLAPYLEQAASASNVRWLAVRVRMERLLSSVEKESEDKKANKQEASAESDSIESAQTTVAEASPEEKSQPAGQEKSAENGDRAKQAPREEPNKNSTSDVKDKDARPAQDDKRESQSPVSTTTEKKVA
jgi:hypothetical protein